MKLKSTVGILRRESAATSDAHRLKLKSAVEILSRESAETLDAHRLKLKSAAEILQALSTIKMKKTVTEIF